MQGVARKPAWRVGRVHLFAFKARIVSLPHAK